MMDNWIDEITEDGVKFIQESNVVFNDAKDFLGEVKTQIPLWEADKAKWKAVVT